MPDFSLKAVIHLTAGTIDRRVGLFVGWGTFYIPKEYRMSPHPHTTGCGYRLHPVSIDRMHSVR